MFRKPTVQLFLLALTSLALYLVAFVKPYSLTEWWRVPHLSIAKIANHDPLAGAPFVAAILALFLLYWLASRLALRAQDAQTLAIVAAGAVAFNAAMLMLYPVDAVDIFDNILRGRMQTLYGANPFYDRPATLPAVRSDVFFGYAGWHGFPTAYGPWWELVAAGAARLAGDGIVANVLAFKLLNVLAFAGAAALVFAALRAQAPRRALYGLTLFAWNPLAIYSVAGNGHNDGLMVLSIALGFYLLARLRFTLAAMALTGGALVKFIPALLIPIVLVAGFKQQSDGWARIRFLLLTGAACAAMVALSYAPYWRGGDVLGTEWRSVMFTTSLPTLIRLTLEPSLGAKTAAAYVSRGALLVTAAWVAGQSIILWTSRRPQVEWTRAVHAGLSILMFYLVVSCLWFQPWYAIWPLALAALLPDSMLARGAIVLSLTALFKMPVMDFVLGVRPGRVPPASVREWPLTFGTLGLAWLYFTYQWMRLQGWLQPHRGARDRLAPSSE